MTGTTPSRVAAGEAASHGDAVRPEPCHAHRSGSL